MTFHLQTAGFLSTKPSPTHDQSTGLPVTPKKRPQRWWWTGGSIDRHPLGRCLERLVPSWCTPLRSSSGVPSRGVEVNRLAPAKVNLYVKREPLEADPGVARASSGE